MSSENKIVPFKPGAVRTPLDGHQILSRSQTPFCKHLGKLVQNMLDRTDDTLFEMADKAETNAIQLSYFDSMRLIRLKRQEIESRFMEKTAESFHSLLLTGSSIENSGLTEAMSMQELSLVDETDLEEDLAITGLVAKTKSRFSHELFAIEQRLAEILPVLEIDDENNPYGPRMICEAFRHALQCLESDIQIKLIVYKLFDKQVVAELGSIYDEVNNYFVDAGVLPELKHKLRKSSSTASTPTTHADENERPSEPTTAAESGLLQTLQALLSDSRSGPSGPGAFSANQSGTPGGTTGQSAYTGGIVASGDLVTTLSSIQTFNPERFLIQDGARPDGKEIKAILLEEYRTATGNQNLTEINKVDGDVIDVVSMMFDFILEDRNLPVAAKALIGRLQIPMVKVAILDKEFFAKKNHAARRLLNQLALAGIGLNEEDDIEQSPVFAIISDAVKTVLNEFTDNLELFEQILEDVEARISEERDRARQIEKETAQDYQYREKLKLASTWVVEAIRERLEGKRVPDIVIDIIKGAWKDVLHDTYLNEGHDSPVWKEQLRFIDILVWSVQPKETASERQKLAGVLLQLLETLRNGLTSINYSDVEIKQTVALLEPIHLACFRGKEHNNAEVIQTECDEMERVDGVLDSAATSDVDDMIARFEEEFRYLDVDAELIEDIILGEQGAPLADTADMPDDEYLRLARQLEAGKWVEFTDDNGKSKRARLAWKSELLEECTFLDWKYRVVADTTFHGLAADFRRGTARVIEDIPLFDRAMDAVVSGLKRRVSGGN